MYYVIYDIYTGRITQWIDTSTNSTTITFFNLQITQTEYENQSSYQYVINGTTLSLTPPTTYYIDSNGIKYSKQLQTSWQPLQCNYNDLILFENGQWVVATSLQQTIYNIKSYNSNVVNTSLNNGYYYSQSLLTFLNFSILAINNIDNLLKINTSTSTINLRLLNNTFINITYTELQNIYNEMLTFKSNLYNEKWNLENIINSMNNLPSWQPNTVYNLNTMIIENNLVYKVIISGTSSNTIPNFDTQNGTNTTDNTVTWICLSSLTNAINMQNLFINNNLLNISQWKPNYSYSYYQYILNNDSLYICQQNGISGATEPTFNTTINTITSDNNINWLNLGNYYNYLNNLLNNNLV